LDWRSRKATGYETKRFISLDLKFPEVTAFALEFDKELLVDQAQGKTTVSPTMSGSASCVVPSMVSSALPPTLRRSGSRANRALVNRIVISRKAVFQMSRSCR
jgi:hypothetical protein